MRYTLRQLEVFLAIAHHQNLTKAADELAMSQSAASSALKDLEERFSTQLFDRIGKRRDRPSYGSTGRTAGHSECNLHPQWAKVVSAADSTLSHQVKQKGPAPLFFSGRIWMLRLRMTCKRSPPVA